MATLYAPCMPWCSMRPSSLAILKATEVIAINQDSLGVPGVGGCTW